MSRSSSCQVRSLADTHNRSGISVFSGNSFVNSLTGIKQKRELKKIKKGQVIITFLNLGTRGNPGECVMLRSNELEACQWPPDLIQHLI